VHWITTSKVLSDLRGFEEQAWNAFVARFRDPVRRFAANLGLTEEDAEEVAQESLAAVAEALREGRYEPSRGRLRSYLFGIVRHRCGRRGPGSARAVRESPAATTFWQETPDEAILEQAWEESWKKARLEQGLAQVRHEIRPRTFRAFSLVAFEELPAAEVGRRLELSENAVWLARHRVLKRLRELMAQFDDEEG
jgi:RNA polymerase sigma-70 factor (ECF subfamily)